MLSDSKLSMVRAATANRLKLSPEFGRRFLVTVDTEEEFDWNGPFERQGHTTVSVPKLKRFQEFSGKLGIRPVYFVDYSIVQNDEARAFLKSVCDDGSAAVGVHLHPWVNPPFEEEVGPANSFSGNLPKELEEAKIVHLSDAIEQATGKRPICYRAGRYGIGPNTFEILTKLGFVLDSSVRSHFDYSQEGGPDFSEFGPEPFWLGDNREMVELPLTTVLSGMLRKQHGYLLRMMNRSSLSAALLSNLKVLERIPLTPEGITAREAMEAIDVALDDGLKLLVFSFHSPSLSPGHTPYVRTDDDLDRFYDWWREVFEHLRAQDVAPAGMDDLLQNSGLAGK
ncbi:polysaccharide deacetylase family protein [Parasphingorhabdus sp.]|uniref:polysaccharide deacetylase family protein n=1 Tax=Parasphingorhabdus sp. TaxID=2709688 RepID=UPI003264DCAF